MSLLDPRVWIAALLAAMAVFGAGYWKGDTAGKIKVRAEWAIEKQAHAEAVAAASEAARAKEQILTAANTKVTNDYNAQKKLRAADAVAVNGKLRDLQAALDSAAGTHAAAEPGDYGDPRSNIIAGCANTVVILDEATKRMAGQTTALQRYISEVCIAP